MEEHMTEEVFYPDTEGYVPYDFTKREDRDDIRGRWIRECNPCHDTEYLVDRFSDGCFMVYMEDIGLYGVSGEDLLGNFVFIDTGEPVGRRKDGLR